MRLVKLTNQVTGRALNSNWARQAHARAMYPTSLFKQRRLSGLTQSGCVLWGIAYGNIMLWDGHTWRYIRKQHLVWRNQLHNVYNVDRCIANSNILYVTFSFFFWSYRISTISHRILVLVSFLACLLTKTPQPHHESLGPWRVLTYFAIDREFKHCWLIVIHSSFFILAVWQKERSASQFVSGKVRNILKVLEKTDCRPSQTWCSALLMETCPIQISEPSELVGKVADISIKVHRHVLWSHFLA